MLELIAIVFKKLTEVSEASQTPAKRNTSQMQLRSSLKRLRAPITPKLNNEEI
jgi:hypothetical protein